MITIDKEFEIPIYSKVCMSCLSLTDGYNKKCKAFPEGIPLEIWMGESVHDKKHPDQKTDFVFEWVEKKAIANRKPRKCPKCDGVKVASIMYGLPAPNPRLEQELKEGKTVLGGCVINTDHDPTWQCIDCGAQIFKGGNSRH